MSIHCIIVDDEPLARNLLREYVSKIPYLSLQATCSNAMEALDALRNHPVDLMFLDIQMPDITGMAFLRSLQKKPMVILTTAYSEYALESYDLDVVDYLLKPITLERFFKAIDKVNQLISQGNTSQNHHDDPIEHDANRTFMFVKDGTKLVKVVMDDILYIEGLKDYVTIHTETQKIITLQRLKNLENILPPEKFIRIHNSFIIALRAVDVVHTNEVEIRKNKIPISDTYKKAFRELIERNQFLG